MTDSLQAGAGSLHLSAGGLPPINRASDVDRLQQGTEILLGQVLDAFHGLQYYDVGGAGWRALCSYHGLSRGRLGAQESAGFIPGSLVWVAFAPGMPRGTGVILAGYSAELPAVSPTVKNPLAYPQVAGFVIDEEKGVADIIGQLLLQKERTRLRNMNGGVPDAVDGDWSMRNLWGGGVSVEGGRATLQGGPMSGVFLHSDDNLTKIVGQTFQLLHFGRELEAGLASAATSEIDRRVHYPVDSILERQPVHLEVEGPHYGGRQQFITYRPTDNFPTTEDGDRTGRIALLHELRGLDGSYILTSASTVLFQKYFGIRVPIEKRGDRTTKGFVNEFPGVLASPVALASLKGTFELPQADLPPSPRDAPGVILQLLKSLHITQPVAPAQVDALALANDLIEQQGAQGFRTLTEQWEYGDLPSEYADAQTDPQGYTGDPYVQNPILVKCQPKVVRVQLTPYGATKEYRLGRSTMGLLPDGSIIFQEAGGASIKLKDGNVYIDAPGDIITTAGKNILNTAGRSISDRAGLHLDAQAIRGNLTVTAANQLSLLGGYAGAGGVLIQSLGERESYGNSENPDAGGDVVIASSRAVVARGKDVFLRADGPGWQGGPSGGMIVLEAGDSVHWSSENGESYGYFGSQIFAKFPDSAISLGKVSIFDHVKVVNNLLYRNQIFSGTSTSAIGVLDRNGRVVAHRLALTTSVTNSMNAMLNVSYPTSAQYFTDRGQFSYQPQPWVTETATFYSIDDIAALPLLVTMPVQPIYGTDSFPGIDLTQQTTLAQGTL